MYSIDFDKYFDKSIEQLDSFKPFIKKLNSDVLTAIKSNPHNGPHIKKLKGKLGGIYRYRIGSFRLFYAIDDKDKRVTLLEVAMRKDVY